MEQAYKITYVAGGCSFERTFAEEHDFLDFIKEYQDCMMYYSCEYEETDVPQ